MKPVLCIPSYSRPDGVALERCKDLPLKKFLFIRKSQLDMYRKWTPYYTLVLQTGGTDIGLVRNNIVRYCAKHNHEWAFVLDDDISKVETLGVKPDGEGITANRIIAGVPGPRMEIEAFKAWFKQALALDLSLSSPNHRAYDRFNHGSIQVNKSACIQCVLLHIPDVMAVGGYKSLHETGNEDYYLQYKLMSAGCLTGKVGCVEYDCPAVGAGEGGNNADEYKDINQRYDYYVQLFLDNVCNDPELIKTKTTKTGQKSVQFIWKNWNGFTVSVDLVGGDIYEPLSK